MEASLFEQFLQTNILNFLIVISTIVWIFKKAHLGDIIQKMADDIKDSVEISSQNAANALNDYKETRKATRGTEELQAKIINQAKINAESIKGKIEEKTAQKKSEIRTNLEKAFESQEENFKNLTVDEIYLASVELAKEEVLKRLNKKVHKKLINSSIDELDKVEGSLS